MSQQKRCFVIMGFGIKTDYATGRTLNLDKSYRLLIKPVVEERGFVCTRADEIRHSGAIDLPMYQELLNADVVIADLSTGNPNVFYQLGLRHALRPSSTLIIAENNLAYPFDLGHVSIIPYEHLGDSIDYSEVLRFQQVLGKILDAVLNSHEIDSPVYTFLNDLIPPSRKLRAEKMTEEVEDAVRVNNDDQLDNDNQTLSLIVSQGEDALKNSQFSLAKSLFKSALQISDVAGNLDSYLIHRLAFSTYKAKEPNEVIALQDAISLLNKLEPNRMNDAETVGLAGRIEKRLYLIKEGEKHLLNAIQYYERAYILLQDRYYGINLAFLLNSRVNSSLSSSDQDKIADLVRSNHIRKEVLEMCKRDLSALEAKKATKDSINALDQLATEQREMENEMMFWILVNKAEAHFGLGEIDEYKEARMQATAILQDQSMIVGFEEQLEKLRVLLRKYGHLLNPAWTDEEENDVEMGSYDKLFTGASNQLKQGNYQKALKYINQVIELDDEKSLNDVSYSPHPELYELKAKISTALGDTSAAKTALDRYEELSNENKYRGNLARKIALDSLVIENLPFFWKFYLAVYCRNKHSFR